MWLKLCGGLIFGVSLLGCAVHTQAPLRTVAYDFSDRDFYDRSYAPSPDYGEEADAHEAQLVTPAAGEPAVEGAAARRR